MADAAARRLVLLRHGRTAWNHEGRAQGHADVPLDDVGREQAAAVAPLVAALGPVRLWSSDLARARQTADAVAAECGLAVETDPRLREYAVGDRQGLTWPESVARFPWIAEGTGLAERLARVPGAETAADVAARVVPAVGEALAALPAGATGVVVSHGAALRQAIGGLLGWGDGAADRDLVVLGNCCWATVVAEPDGTRRLAAYGLGRFAWPEPVG